MTSTQLILQPGEVVNVVGFGPAILESRFGHAHRANVWSVTWLGKRGTPVKNPQSGRKVRAGDMFNVTPSDRVNAPSIPRDEVTTWCMPGSPKCADCRRNGR